MRTIATALAFALAASAAKSAVVTRDVDYEQGGVKLSGFLAYDDSVKTPRPGVLVVHEWWGLNDYVKGRATQLANLGYVAFALDMYGAGVVTHDPKKAGELSGQFYGSALMAERAQAGLDQLVGTGLVDPDKVAAIGYCFGGSTVQALAYSGAKLAGIVSFHGGLIPVPADAAAKNHARFLICHGAIDPFVKKEAVDAFLHSMNEGKFDYVFTEYAGAKHAFTNPESDANAARGLNGVAYSPSADRRSWRAMQDFFSEIFGTQGG